MLEINKSVSGLHPILWNVNNQAYSEFSTQIIANLNQKVILCLLIHPQGTSREQGRLDRRFFARLGIAALLGEESQAIAIKQDALGCPRILVRDKPCPWFLSFAARARYSLIGMAQSPLGVDLECPFPPSTIPWNILRSEEQEALKKTPERERMGHFLSLWCRKEAILKALGTGFRVPPEKLEIPIIAEDWHEFECCLPAAKGMHSLSVKAQALHLTDAPKPAFNLYEMRSVSLSTSHIAQFNKENQPDQNNDIDLMITACVCVRA